MMRGLPGRRVEPKRAGMTQRMDLFGMETKINPIKRTPLGSTQRGIALILLKKKI